MWSTTTRRAQGLLVLNAVRFEQTVGGVLTMTALIGAWLLISGLLARGGRTMPPGLIGVMVVLGLASLLAAIGFWLGGDQHLLAALGFLVGVVASPLWSIWLGRLLLSGRLVQFTWDAGLLYLTLIRGLGIQRSVAG
jgi:hypothetical protein